MAEDERITRELYAEYYTVLKTEFVSPESAWPGLFTRVREQFAHKLRHWIKRAASESLLTADSDLRPNIKKLLTDDYTLQFTRPLAYKPKQAAVPNSVKAIGAAEGAAMATLFTLQLFKHAKQVINKPDANGVFSPWHYALFSVVAGVNIVSLANNVRLAAKLANINQNKVTMLGIQSGAAATLGVTVLGGFAKQALATAGPIGFFIINGGMMLKALFDGFRNLWHANRLQRHEYVDTAAYHTYRQRAKQHFKGALKRGLMTAAIGLVVTFAPYVALGISLFAAAVMASVKIIETLPKIVLVIKRVGRWLAKAFGRRHQIERIHQDRSQATVMTAPAIETVTAVVSNMTDSKQVDAISDWKQQREFMQANSGLRDYDKRFHYRDDQLLLVAKAYQARPDKAISIMRDRVLAILRAAMVEYNNKSLRPSFKVNAGQMRKKLALTQAMAGLVATGGDALSLSRLHALVKRHNGGWFVRGAMGSYAKRVGGMQSIVEAVEFYMAFANAGGKIADIDVSALCYQHSNAYALSGRQTRRQASQRFIVRLFRPENMSGDECIADVGSSVELAVNSSPKHIRA